MNTRPCGPKPKPAKPTPLAGRPKRPDGLGTEAAAHWDSVVELVEAAGLLSLLDADALRIYIDAWMRYRRAKIACDKEGFTVEGLHEPKVNPHYYIMKDSIRILRDYGDRFGLTPLGRSRLKAEPLPNDVGSKWEGFGIVD